MLKAEKECNLNSKRETIESIPLLLLLFVNETGLSIRHTHIHYILYTYLVAADWQPLKSFNPIQPSTSIAPID